MHFESETTLKEGGGVDPIVKLNCKPDDSYSDSGLNHIIQQDKMERSTAYQEYLLLKLKRRGKKISKLKQKQQVSAEKIKLLIREKQVLEEKNKRLGWLLLQRQFEAGEKLPETSFSEKASNSILCLLDADISDLFL